MNLNRKCHWQILRLNHMLRLWLEPYTSRPVKRKDQLGTKVIFSGILEDATFKMPFVSHKLNIPWQRDTIYKFDNAYVHEFPDQSLLLVITDSQTGS